MKRLKALADKLRDAQSHVATELSSAAEAEQFVRSKMRSFAIRHLFKRLPNDVLALIVKESALVDAKAPARLARVCKSFHNVLLALPSVWTYISSRDQTAEEAQAVAAKCPLPMLSVSLESPAKSTTYRTLTFINENNNFLRTLEQVSYTNFFEFTRVALAERIRDLRIVLDLNRHQESLKLLILDYPVPLCFPHLEELEISYTVPCADVNLLGLAFSIHPYQRWILPALRTLSTRNVIPRIPQEHRKGVKSLSMQFQVGLSRTHQFEMKWPANILLEYLASFVNLKELSLAIGWDAFHPAFSSIQTPSVEKLSLKLTNPGAGVVDLLRALKFPKVSHMVLDYCMNDEAELFSALNIGIFHARTPFANLKSLRARFFIEHKYETGPPLTYVIGNIVHDLKELEELSLEIDNCWGCLPSEFSVDPCVGLGERIRTVELSGVCGAMMDEFFRAVKVAEQRKGSKFQSFVVKNYGRMPMRKGDSFVLDSGRTFRWCVRPDAFSKTIYRHTDRITIGPRNKTGKISIRCVLCQSDASRLLGGGVSLFVILCGLFTTATEIVASV